MDGHVISYYSSLYTLYVYVAYHIKSDEYAYLTSRQAKPQKLLCYDDAFGGKEWNEEFFEQKWEKMGIFFLSCLFGRFIIEKVLRWVLYWLDWTKIMSQSRTRKKCTLDWDKTLSFSVESKRTKGNRWKWLNELVKYLKCKKHVESCLSLWLFRYMY